MTILPMFLTSQLAGCSIWNELTFDPGDGQDIVDAHCHVFNASDLPTARFLRQVVLGDYPTQSYKITRIRDPDVADRFFELFMLLMRADIAPTAAEELAFLAGNEAPKTQYLSPIAAKASAIEDTARFLVMVSQRRRGVEAKAESTNSAMERSQKADIDFLDAFLGRTSKVHRNQAGPLSLSDARVAGKVAFAEQGALSRYLNWFSLFRLYRHVLVQTLISDTRDQGFNPIMISPALVDFDEWLYEDVKSSLSSQAAVMGAISARYAKDLAQPLVHGYIGFDPLREIAHRRNGSISSLSTFRNALTKHGFLGAKLYPPMGFRPLNNDGPYPKRTLKALGYTSNKQLSAALDKVLIDFYTTCVELDAPILAHAYESNASGPKYAERGDPAYWIPVFEKFPTLRVCLAHFGRFDKRSAGMVYTDFPQGSWEWTTGEFIKLNPKRPIFVDISYFSEALSSDAKTKAKLASDFKLWISEFDPKAEHVVFGTDWLMLGKEAGYGHYVEAVYAFLKGDCSLDDAACANIFKRNAERFLPLQYGSKGRRRLVSWYERNGLDSNRLPTPVIGKILEVFRGE